MTLRQLPYILVCALMLSSLVGCNSNDEDYEIEALTYSDVAINGFKLKRNDSVIKNLDTVFFAIDLDGRRIFNPDSLPVGTDSVRAQVNLSLPPLSEAMIYFTSAHGLDSIDYLKTTTDTVDFSRGPVRIHVVSYDKSNKADYTVNINIHRMQPDSLWWNATEVRPIPTDLSSILRQRTIEWRGQVCCFTTDDQGQVCMASADAPDASAWHTRRVNLPAGTDLSSITPNGDYLYLLADNCLMRSTDADTWSDTGVKMSYIYGIFADYVLGNLAVDNGYVCIRYPGQTDPATAPAMPESAPIADTSNPMTYHSEWSALPLFTVVGGLCADGSITGDCWSYDGTSWALTSMAAPPARRGAVLVPYFAFRTSAYWIVTRRSVLLTFGGLSPKGLCDNTMYISYDSGIHWAKGDQLIQPPYYLPTVYGADAMVYSSRLSSRSASDWTPMPDRPIPGWLTPERPLLSRSAEPNTSDTLITSWECPYIYMIGGRYNTGRTENRIWRGVINRLTFKPLQ